MTEFSADQRALSAVLHSWDCGCVDDGVCDPYYIGLADAVLSAGWRRPAQPLAEWELDLLKPVVMPTDEGFVRCEYTCESGYMCTLRAGHTTNHTSEGAG